MSFATGTRLGPYEIQSAIGAGGMGEVYKATDTRLDRIVAIKVLPDALASDPQFRERFDREAKSISSLNHPNICTLFDVGEGSLPAREAGLAPSSVSYIVMEFIDGDTLAARLMKGALPFAEALKIATEIAGALDKAHRQGIVHRDLKPGNIMLTKAGAKLLDFGLAKIGPAGSVTSHVGTIAQTMTKPLTQQGTILGTFQYMAPEQIDGQDADARTDIFAFGAVLFEMLTGTKAFTGKSQASLLGAIMKDEPPPVSQVLPVAPPALDQVVRHCLAKDPDDRFQTAHDLLLQLRWIAGGGSAAGLPAPVVISAGRKRVRLAIAIASGVVIALVAGFAGYLARPAQETRVTRFTVPPPEKSSFGEAIAMSPDGKRLAFIASGGGGSSIWVRALDTMAAQPLPGTEGAQVSMFWSPDSAFIGFFADGKLKKVSVAGGPAETVCDAAQASGGTWSKDNVIVFAAGSTGGLSRVSSAGGTPAALTTLDATRKETSHRWPAFLPDGRHVLYLGRSGQTDNNAVFVTSVDDPGHSTLLLPVGVNASNAIYVSSGYLMFVRERSLMAQPFDAKALKLTGEAFPVAENVGMSATRIYLGTFSTSDTGVLAYGAGTAPNRQYAWFDRAGKELARLAPTGNFTDVRLSPDGTRAAVGQITANNPDIWIMDLARGVPSRLTFDPAFERYPVWSPDSTSLLYYSSRDGANIFRKLASAMGAEAALLKTGTLRFPTDWSRDGRLLLYFEIDSKTRNDIYVLPLSGEPAPMVFLKTEFNEDMARFSPDGKWIAYASDETGRYEVYVQSFPASGGKAQISTGGASWPSWSKNGNELIYLAADRKLMAVPIKGGAADGIPLALFGTQIESILQENRFSVTADGQRFLINVSVGAPVTTPLSVVMNWTAGIRK